MYSIVVSAERKGVGIAAILDKEACGGLTERVTEKQPEVSGGAWIRKAGKLREEKGTGPEASACPP